MSCRKQANRGKHGKMGVDKWGIMWLNYNAAEGIRYDKIL
jgi:hypothetical protein